MCVYFCKLDMQYICATKKKLLPCNTTNSVVTLFKDGIKEPSRDMLNPRDWFQFRNSKIYILKLTVNLLRGAEPNTIFSFICEDLL